MRHGSSQVFKRFQDFADEEDKGELRRWYGCAGTSQEDRCWCRGPGSERRCLVSGLRFDKLVVEADKKLETSLLMTQKSKAPFKAPPAGVRAQEGLKVVVSWLAAAPYNAPPTCFQLGCTADVASSNLEEASGSLGPAPLFNAPTQSLMCVNEPMNVRKGSG